MDQKGLSLQASVVFIIKIKTPPVFSGGVHKSAGHIDLLGIIDRSALIAEIATILSL